MHTGLQSLAASRQSQLQPDRSSQSAELSAALSVVPKPGAEPSPWSCPRLLAFSGAVRGAGVQALALSVVPKLQRVKDGPEPSLELSLVLTLSGAVHKGCQWC